MGQEYFTGYFFVAVFLAAGGALVVGGLIASRLLAPRGNKGGAKLDTYESGEEAVGQAQVQFPVGFYIFALLFVIFDVQAIFLLAWAAHFGELGALGLIVMTVFVGVLVAGFVYAWRKGGLKWT